MEIKTGFDKVVIVDSDHGCQTHYNYTPLLTRPRGDAIAVALHSALSHLKHKGNYARILFIDYSSAFNTIILDILAAKLTHLGLPSSSCRRVTDYLTNRQQTCALALTFPPPSHSTLAILKDACWLHFCTLCTHMTVVKPTPPTTSSNLQLTHLNLGSSQVMSLPTDGRWRIWQSGAQWTTSLWTPLKQKNSSWTSRKTVKNRLLSRSWTSEPSICVYGIRTKHQDG